jgi:ankyrin repeat protein
VRLRALALAALLALLLAACGGDGDEEGGGETQAQTTAATSTLSSELRDAVRANDVEEARRLLEEGADPNELDPNRQSAFLLAAARPEDDPALVQLLLEHEGDVRATNAEGDTPLILAARNGAQRVVAALVEADSPLDHVNQSGWTALHAAVILGDGSEPYFKTVQSLLDAGANPAIGDSFGFTPLVHARTAGQVEVIRLLAQADGG